MEFTSLWDEASRDLDEESRERVAVLASQASAGIWQFLAAAKSEPEFETRLALAESQISTVAAETGAEVDDITATMRRRYALLVEASQDEDEDGDDDGDDSDSDGDDSDDDGDDSSGDSADDDSDSDDSDGDDSDDDSDSDDSDEDDSEEDDSEEDDGTGNPFAKDSSLRAEATPWYSQDHHLSEGCKEGGDGQCDGYGFDEGKTCDCPCHEAWDLPSTVEGVKKWHNQYHGVVPPKESSLTTEALLAQINAGINPLSPEFGKEAWAKAITVAAPAAIDMVKGLGDKKEEAPAAAPAQPENGGIPANPMDATKNLKEKGKAILGEVLASEEPGDNEYGGRYRKPESLDVFDSNNSIQHYTPKTVDPDHSPDAGQVHIMDAKRMANGKHNVMVIDANGNSQWPIRYDNGSLGFDNPHSIVTPHEHIHSAFDKAQQLDNSLGTVNRFAALKQEILDGVDPLSPDFGKTAGPAAILPMVLRAAPMLMGGMGGGKSEGAEDEDNEPEGVLEEGAESSRLPFVRKSARDWNGETTPTEFCNELKKYDDLWNTGGREHDSSCPVHGGPNADEAFSSWKEHVSKQSSKSAAKDDWITERDTDGKPHTHIHKPSGMELVDIKKAPRTGYDDSVGKWNVFEPGNTFPINAGSGSAKEWKSWVEGEHAKRSAKEGSKIAAGNTCPNCGSDKALVAIPQGPNLNWVCQEPGCGWSGAPGSAPMNMGDYGKVSSKTASEEPQVHTFDSSGDAYNQSQYREDIKDGDVLSVPSENVHGFLNQAWPIATHHDGDPGEFHTINPEHKDEVMSANPKYQRAHEIAEGLHASNPTKGPKPVDQHHLDALDKRFPDGGYGKPKWHPDKPNTIIHDPNNTWDGPKHIKVNDDGTYGYNGYQGKETFDSNGRVLSREGSKTAGAAADMGATTNTGGIPQKPMGFGGVPPQQATTKPRQSPGGSPVSGPGGHVGPNGPAGPGAPSEDSAPPADFNPSANGGDVKQGNDDMPGGDIPGSFDKGASLMDRLRERHPDMDDESLARVASLISEAAVNKGVGLRYQEPRTPNTSNWTRNLSRAMQNARPDVSDKIEDKIKGRVQPQIDKGKKIIDTQKQQLVQKVKDKVQPPAAPGYDYDPSDAPEPVDLTGFDTPTPGMQPGPKHRGDTVSTSSGPGRHRASLEDNPLLLG